MSTLSTLLYQYLSSSFAGLDWEQGSIIRELVAEPVVGLADAANAAINDAYAQLDIQTLLDNPTKYATEIDTLFETLGLTAPAATQSSGTVKILTSSNADIQIPAGSVFTYQDYSLVTGATMTLTLTPEEPGDIQLYPLGINAYYAVIPVTSASAGVNLGVGVELSWYNLDASIYSVSVASTITGGVGAYTPVQKINTIRQRLFPLTLTCRESLLRTINYYLPDSAVDCKFSASNSGSANIELFVKTTAAPQTWSLTPLSAVGVISGVGVAQVLSINDDPSIEFTTLRVGRNIEITPTTDVLIKSVQVLGLKSLTNIQEVLDSFTTGTGLQINVLTPRLLFAAVNIPNTTGTFTNNLLLNVTAAINNTLLDNNIVGDSLVYPILNAGGVGTPYAGTYTLTDPLTGEVSQALVTCDATPFMRYGTPYAIYTTIDRVSYNSAV